MEQLDDSYSKTLSNNSSLQLKRHGRTIGTFSCTGLPSDFYADMFSHCKIYYQCYSNSIRYTYYCPAGFIFNEASERCESEDTYECPINNRASYKVDAVGTFCYFYILQSIVARLMYKIKDKESPQ